MTFECKVRTRDGVTQVLRRDGETLAQVSADLRANGFMILDVRAAKEAGGARRVPRIGVAWLLPMTSLDVELGLRQLSSMLVSGVSVLLALRTVAEQARKPRAMRVWLALEARIRTGANLSDAMGAFPRVFNEEVVQLMRVGEQSGEMDVVMLRAAEQLEAHRALRMTVVNAMVYPCLATAMAIGVSVYLVMVVIPKISVFLQSGGAALPPVTQFLMDLSAWLHAHGLKILVGLAAVTVAWVAVRKTKAGCELQDAFLLRIPILGNIMRLAGTAIFARGMGLLIESGVTLLDALGVVAKLLVNRRLAHRVENARLRVMQGNALADALDDAPEFMPMLSRMTAVAETTGSLASTFNEIARFHETLLTLAIKRFSMMIEPAMIVVTGGIVGFVYIAFFVALFSMAGAV